MLVVTISGGRAQGKSTLMRSVSALLLKMVPGLRVYTMDEDQRPLGYDKSKPVWTRKEDAPAPHILFQTNTISDSVVTLGHALDVAQKIREGIEERNRHPAPDVPGEGFKNLHTLSDGKKSLIQEENEKLEDFWARFGKRYASGEAEVVFTPHDTRAPEQIQLEKLIEKMPKYADDTVNVAYKMAHAIQMFRNEAQLGRSSKLRATQGYSMLVNAWDEFIEYFPDARLSGKEINIARHKKKS